MLKNVVGSSFTRSNVNRYVMSSVAEPSAPDDVWFLTWISYRMFSPKWL